MNSYTGKQSDSSPYLKEYGWDKFMKRNNCQSYGYIGKLRPPKTKT